MKESTLIDITELSGRLKVARGTLYNWVYHRRIPYIKIGRLLRFDPVEVEQIIRHTPIMGAAGQRWKGH